MAENREFAEAMARLDALTDRERRPRKFMRVGLEPMHNLAERLVWPQRRPKLKGIGFPLRPQLATTFDAAAALDSTHFIRLRRGDP